jgi:hypothetical protein
MDIRIVYNDFSALSLTEFQSKRSTEHVPCVKVELRSKVENCSMQV